MTRATGSKVNPRLTAESTVARRAREALARTGAHTPAVVSMANSAAMSDSQRKRTPREWASRFAVIVIVALVVFGTFLVWWILRPL